MSILRAVGIEFETRMIWNTGSNLIFSILLFTISLYLMVIGLFYNPHPKEKLLSIKKQPGRLVSDFYLLFGETCYINMSILGFISTLLVIFLDGDLNGPTIIWNIHYNGFGAFGKHLRNVVPIIIGALIGALIHVNPINSPSLILSILFLQHFLLLPENSVSK
jgi:hypothetical protein